MALSRSPNYLLLWQKDCALEYVAHTSFKKRVLEKLSLTRSFFASIAWDKCSRVRENLSNIFNWTAKTNQALLWSVGLGFRLRLDNFAVVLTAKLTFNAKCIARCTFFGKKHLQWCLSLARLPIVSGANLLSLAWWKAHFDKRNVCLSMKTNQIWMISIAR